MPNNIIRVKDQGETKEALDMIVLRPLRLNGLTDSEAQCLYSLWKGAPKGSKEFSPAGDQKSILALKTKGYVAGGLGTLKITEKGRKVIIEMATNEPNAFDKQAQMPTYSEIKSAKQRPRQTFIKKSSSEPVKPFNLAKRRALGQAQPAAPAKPGWWRSMLQQTITNPAKAWGAGVAEQAGDWYASYKSTGCRTIAKNLISRSQLSMKTLNEAAQQSKTGLDPAFLINNPNWKFLYDTAKKFYQVVGRDANQIPKPDDAKYQSGQMPGKMDQTSFANFFRDLDHALSVITEEECVRFEKQKGTQQQQPAQPAAAQPIQTPQEDLEFVQTLVRAFYGIRSLAPTAVNAILTDLKANKFMGNDVATMLANVMTGVGDERQLRGAYDKILPELDKAVAAIEQEWSQAHPNPTRPVLDRANERIDRIMDDAQKWIPALLLKKFKAMTPWRYQQQGQKQP